MVMNLFKKCNFPFKLINNKNYIEYIYIKVLQFILQQMILLLCLALTPFSLPKQKNVEIFRKSSL